MTTQTNTFETRIFGRTFTGQAHSLIEASRPASFDTVAENRRGDHYERLQVDGTALVERYPVLGYHLG
ncbi:MAG: hypothetical protein V5A62_08855 [Haloarculaceae archaeon]